MFKRTHIQSTQTLNKSLVGFRTKKRSREPSFATRNFHTSTQTGVRKHTDKRTREQWIYACGDKCKMHSSVTDSPFYRRGTDEDVSEPYFSGVIKYSDEFTVRINVYSCDNTNYRKSKLAFILKEYNPLRTFP